MKISNLIWRARADELILRGFTDEENSQWSSYCWKKATDVLNNFIEDRLVKQTTGFYEPIKKQKLSTLSKLKKLVKLKIQDNVVQLTEQKKSGG